MGIRVNIGGQSYEPDSFSLTDSSTPIATSDTSGAIANFTVGLRTSRPRHEWLTHHGTSIEVVDSRRGTLPGTIEGTSFSDDGASVTLTCVTRLGLLNAYGIQAQPYTGTLGGAFTYYLSLAGVTTDIHIDATIASIPVSFIGWNGELWFHLKQLAAAYLCELSLIDGIITFEPIRRRTLPAASSITRNMAAPGNQLARAVEVVVYQTTPIVNKLIYPPGGWKPEVDPITVNAGETLEQVLSIDASVSAVQQPSFRTVVTPGHASSSVFSVVGDDGLPITEAAWRGAGGKILVTIGEDTRSLILKVTAPKNLPSSKGVELKTFSLALSSGESNRYSTLRIVGTGVAYKTKKHRVSTCVAPTRTATDVGATIDNIFLTDPTRAWSAGMRVAKQYTGRATSFSASIPSAIAFGEGAGGRVWDESSRRWYRARNVTYTKEQVSYDADGDLTYADVDSALAGKTYAQVKAMHAGLTYGQVATRGAPL